MLKGMDLVATFVDSAVSGFKRIALRPEGAKLVSMVQSGEVQVVIIVKLDRAFRNTIDCLETVDRWEKLGTALHITDMGGNAVDTTSPAGRFMLTVLAASCEMERGQIRVRCNAGRRARKAEGKRIGEIPYGWNLAADGKTLVENPAEQIELALIYSMHDAGQSNRAIAAELNRRGIRAKKGGLWTHGQVQSVLKKRRAA